MKHIAMRQIFRCAQSLDFFVSCDSVVPLKRDSNHLSSLPGIPLPLHAGLFSFVPAGTWPRRQHEIVFRLETGDVKTKRSGNNKAAVCLLRPVTLLPAYCRFCFLSLSSSLSLSLSPRTGGGSTMMIPSVGSSIRAEAFALLPGGKGVHTYLISWSG